MCHARCHRGLGFLGFRLLDLGLMGSGFRGLRFRVEGWLFSISVFGVVLCPCLQAARDALREAGWKETCLRFRV